MVKASARTPERERRQVCAILKLVNTYDAPGYPMSLPVIRRKAKS